MIANISRREPFYRKLYTKKCFSKKKLVFSIHVQTRLFKMLIWMMVLKQSRQNPRVKIRFIHEATKIFKTRSNDIVMWKPKYVKRSFYMHAEIWEDGRVWVGGRSWKIYRKKLPKKRLEHAFSFPGKQTIPRNPFKKSGCPHVTVFIRRLIWSCRVR